jgi:hypothetical protein
MTYATVWMEADVTYTETTTATRTGGSLQDTWGYWVVAGTTAQQQAALTTCVNTQFANMRNTASGLSITIDAMRQGATRAYAVPQTW